VAGIATKADDGVVESFPCVGGRYCLLACLPRRGWARRVHHVPRAATRAAMLAAT